MDMIIISFSSSFEIKIINNNYLKYKNKYDFDFSKDNLKNIFKKVINLDGTISRKIKRGEDFRWNISISNQLVESKRFQNLLPYIILNKHAHLKMYNFQKEGSKWLLDNPCRILADDMGLGKTLQSNAIQNLF